jgi:tetratricopeptide (TPR) repeat protein
MAAGQQAAMGKFLAFSRTQESSADAAGADYLAKAGISGRGSLEFFKKLQNQEFRLAIPQEDSYARTHPLSGERISTLEGAYKAQPGWDKKTDPALEARFQRVKAKLTGFVNEPRQTLALYPETNKTVPGRYARAYAWHKSAYPDKSIGEVDSLLAESPNDPYFLELKGQVLLESGRPREALPPLREAVGRAPDQPLISALLGHALISTEEKANFDEAKKVLRSAISRDNTNPFAWYQLGHRLQSRRRRCPRRARDGRALQSRRPHEARARQCRDGDAGHSHRHARLDPRAGHRDGLPRGGRKGKGPEALMAEGSGDRRKMIAAGLVGLAVGGGAVAAVSGGGPLSGDRAQVERIVREYVLANPSSSPKRCSACRTARPATSSASTARRSRPRSEVPGRAPRSRTSCWWNSSTMPAVIAGRAMPTSIACWARTRS